MLVAEVIALTDPDPVQNCNSFNSQKFEVLIDTHNHLYLLLIVLANDDTNHQSSNYGYSEFWF